MKAIGARLRRDTRDIVEAEIPEQMRDLLRQLEQSRSPDAEPGASFVSCEDRAPETPGKPDGET